MTTRSDHKPTEALTLFGTSSLEVRARLGSWRDTATHELMLRPFRTLTLAFGAGYLLGGGLFSRLTWRAAKLALRFGPVIALALADGDSAERAVPRRMTDVRSHSPTKRKHS